MNNSDSLTFQNDSTKQIIPFRNDLVGKQLAAGELTIQDIWLEKCEGRGKDEEKRTRDF